MKKKQIDVSDLTEKRFKTGTRAYGFIISAVIITSIGIWFVPWLIIIGILLFGVGFFLIKKVEKLKKIETAELDRLDQERRAKYQK